MESFSYALWCITWCAQQCTKSAHLSTPATRPPLAQLLLIKMKSNTGRLPDSSGCVWLSLAPELTGARTVLLSLLPVQAGSCSTWLGLGESGACIHTDALADWLKLVGSGTCIEGCQNCLVESSASIYGWQSCLVGSGPSIDESQGCLAGSGFFLLFGLAPH